MSAKLIFTGGTGDCLYPLTPFEKGMAWLRQLDTIGLDTETNVVDSILLRELKVISIADIHGATAWVIEFSYLTSHQWKELSTEIRKKLVLAHNITFDLSILRKYGCDPQKVYCTMLGEQVLTTGLSKEKGHDGLAGTLARRFDVDISKNLQTSFGDEPMSTAQIQYAAYDVILLGRIKEQQRLEMSADDKFMGRTNRKGLLKTHWHENEYARVVTSMEMNGVKIDKEKWYEISKNVQPIYDAELISLNEVAIRDFKPLLLENKWYSEEGYFPKPIWSSTAKKKEILEMMLGEPIEGTSKVALKKLLEEKDPDFPTELRGKTNTRGWSEHAYPHQFKTVFTVLKLLIIGTADATEYLDKFVMDNYEQVLIQKGWYVPANTITLNWASPAQRLAVFQEIDLSIESTSKDILKDKQDLHPIIQHYLKWNETAYVLKSFGKDFYDKWVELDGKHRTRIRQILATGRISSTSPNILNIPSKDIYRNCFVPEKGWSIVGADYGSMELVIVATLAGEHSWIDAFEKGQDLHSINAHFMYRGRWEAAAEPDCAYFISKQKCKCAMHGDMRTKAKVLTFSSLYGASHIKLAFLLKISEEEAKELLKNFFAGVSDIAKLMKTAQRYVLDNGRIYESVFGRSRFFDKWKLGKPEERNGIQRAAGNFIIQAAGASITKLAAVLFQRWIRNNKLEDNVKLLLTVHDELLVTCTDGMVTQTEEAVTKYMELASKLAGFNIAAEAANGKSWGEAH
tara:strand:- start:186 stop:2408 length:2223 start_codon:yes stop_codon:yes gene_type:complete